MEELQRIKSIIKSFSNNEDWDYNLDCLSEASIEKTLNLVDSIFEHFKFIPISVIPSISSNSIVIKYKKLEKDIFIKIFESNVVYIIIEDKIIKEKDLFLSHSLNKIFK